MTQRTDKPTMMCPRCGAANADDKIECAKCGEPLLEVLAERTGSSTLSGVAPTVVIATDLPTVKPGQQSITSLSATEVTGSIYQSMGSAGLGASFSPVSSEGSTSGERASDPPLTGVFGNRYEILEMIGEGGMGRVYKARDQELDKIIALKTIRGDTGTGSGGGDAVQRFKQELVLARKITHKNVVRIFDLGEAQGQKFFTMEYIEGQSLKALIRSRGRLPVKETVPMSQQILGALQEAHAQGVIHRDLKPQNIMVDMAGVPHLMDFGIARSVDTTGMTATGAIIGTPDYMSPEQVKGARANEGSDLFSFGVILYEMLTGDVPYHADTPISKIVMRLTHKPRAVREINEEIPKYLEQIVQKCMEVDPALRYHSVGEILADFDREVVDRDLTVRMQRGVWRNWKTLTAAGLAAAAAAGGALWLTRGERAAKPAEVAVAVQTLAIVPFTNATGQAELEWLRTGLPDMLVTDLSQSKYVRPVASERVMRVLQEAGLGQIARFDEKALDSVAKLTRAQSILTGQFVEAGGRLRLDLSLRKSGSGVPVPLKVDIATADVFGAVDQLGQQIKQHLDLSPEQIRGDVDRPIAEVTTASLEAQQAYQAGVAELQRGSNQDAIPHFKEATAKDPNFALAFARLADAHLKMGQGDEAGLAIERARTLSEKTALPLAARYQIHATQALVKDDLDTAAKSYDDLAKLYPDDPEIQMSLADSQAQLGKLPEALQAYKRVRELAPQHGAALLGLGRVQVMSGQPAEAISALNDALATKQFDAEPEALGMIHSILGVAYRETSQLDKSLEHLGMSLTLRQKTGDKRGQAMTHGNLAAVYEYRGQIDRALDAEQKALALFREMKDRAGESLALNNLGLTYKVAGRLDKSLEAFRESLRIETEREDIAAMANRLNKVADIYRMQGKYDDALIYLQQAATHLEKTSEVQEKALNLSYTGVVRKAQGSYEAALEALLASLPLFQQIDNKMGVAMAQHDLAEIYSAQGRYGDAYGALQQSLEIYTQLHVEHDIAEVKAPLGHLLASLGLTEQAEKELTDAQRIAAEAKAEGILPEILLGRAEIAHLRHKHEEAAKLFEEANVKANLSGQKEVAVESRIELGHLYLEQGNTASAERLLLRTRQEAVSARLRPLEAAAAAALAEVYLAKKNPTAARQQAADAVSLADKFSGRPTLFTALTAQGQALEQLGRQPEALDSFAKAATTLEFMRGSLRPEHVEPFMRRDEVQAFLKNVLPKLEQGGRAAEVIPLKKWIAAGGAKGR